ncbi:MAG: ABC transporter substrate-binding protein [Chloroflexi bacterium]|nr:ABC transporter substrate-binding protein [Chloroflexota bacterium]
MPRTLWQRSGFLLGALSALGLLTAAACGGGQEATPTATATVPSAVATNTPIPTATPTTSGTAPTSTVVVATPTATATRTPTPVPSVQPKKGGQIKQSAGEDPQSYDPHTATSAAHNIHNQKMYSALLWNPKDDQIVTDAAESYSISADGKVWTFKLRPGIKYHTGLTPAHARDGTTMTAKDVKWSLEKLMGLRGDIISARSGWMKEFIDIDRPDNGIEVVDELTLKIHLLQPFSSLANLLAIGFSGIMPEGITSKDMQQRPYGSGPFKLKSFQRGALWQYARNTDYFKPGLPYLVQWDLVLMDGDAIIQAAFLTHQVDVSGGNPTDDNKAVFDKRSAEGEIYIMRYSSDCRPQGVVMNSTKAPFNDKRLREAVNIGIDRDAYTKVVHNGYAAPELLQYTAGPGRTEAEIRKLPGWRTPHTADLEEAKKIVKELYPNGLELKMMSRNTSGYMRQNEFIAGELNKIGLKVTLEAVDTSIIFDRAAKLDYNLWTYWFCQTTNTPEEYFGSYFVTGGSRNWFGYSDTKVDAAYLDMAGTMDAAAKHNKARAMEDTINAFLPMAPVPVHTTTRMAYSYVKDLPLGITQYSREKNELIWRSDI